MERTPSIPNPHHAQENARYQNEQQLRYRTPALDLVPATTKSKQRPNIAHGHDSSSKWKFKSFLRKKITRQLVSRPIGQTNPSPLHFAVRAAEAIAFHFESDQASDVETRLPSIISLLGHDTHVPTSDRKLHFAQERKGSPS